ncbi:hypothetical protein [Erythrobacter donghaensis]|uniref:hypothetical protein n=1 Tax=Erythrobacter donghaensis TaxID=267135 RepID=UPI000939B6F9|nr:hypothetical protein [Erythrobacter donghaensis]
MKLLDADRHGLAIATGEVLEQPGRERARGGCHLRIGRLHARCDLRAAFPQGLAPGPRNAQLERGIGRGPLAPAAEVDPDPEPQPSPQPTQRPKSTIGARIRPGAAAGPADTGNPRTAGDSERVGTSRSGEPLYAARWYREPTDQELGGYLSTANGPGHALIECRTVSGYYVEDCALLSEGPQGSQIGRAVLAAAWQFRVRPARINGAEQFGTWVRIRIDYTVSRAKR